MKRPVLLILMLLLPLGVFAQRAERGVLLAAGVSAGTTGLAAEVSALLPQEIGFRAGFNWLQAEIPIPVKLPESFGGDGTTSGFAAQLNMNHGYLLADMYLRPDSGFHLTGGIWAGNSVFVRLHNTAPLPDSFNSVGIDVDGYSVHAVNGDLSAELRVNPVKPYIGVGFGRPRPDRRLSVCFDMGLLWWGNPGVYAVGYSMLDEEKEVQLTSAVMDDMDKGILDKIGHVLIWPVLRCSVYYRIF